MSVKYVAGEAELLSDRRLSVCVPGTARLKEMAARPSPIDDIKERRTIHRSVTASIESGWEEENAVRGATHPMTAGGRGMRPSQPRKSHVGATGAAVIKYKARGKCRADDDGG